MGTMQRGFSGRSFGDSFSKQLFALAIAFQGLPVMLWAGYLIPNASMETTMPSNKRGRARAAAKGPGDRRPRPARGRKKK